MESEKKTCPSSKFSRGSYLIGIKNDQEEIDLLAEPIKITKDLYEQLKSGEGEPERALRVASKCVTSGCKQWTGDKCGVIDEMLDKVEESYLKDQLPDCAIRPTCRWYSQQGELACKVCPLITTYTEYPQEDKFFNH